MPNVRSYNAGGEEEYLPTSFMEWSATTATLSIHVTMVVFNQHLNHFKVATAA